MSKADTAMRRYIHKAVAQISRTPEKESIHGR